MKTALSPLPNLRIIELEDTAWNTSTSIMENALTVTQKGRAVRK